MSRASNPDVLEYARERLSYDPETGVLRWVIHQSRERVGLPAGGLHVDGYLIVCLKKHRLLAHRLAWLMFHGCWPVQMLDHMNGDRQDNRIANLREATNAVNTQNTRAARATSKSGLLGVKVRHNGTFGARIVVAGKDVWLGTFRTAEEARDAYVAGKRLLHEGCTL